MTNNSPSRARRQIRLPADAYLVPGRAWLVTVGTKDRMRIYDDPYLATDTTAAIRERCAVRGIGLAAYCLMPDHLHLLLQVIGTGVDDVVGDVKSRTTRVWWVHGGTGQVWQRRFYDHGLRTGADYERAVSYVLDNAVRAGLVEEWCDYPFVGGSLIDEE